MIKNQIKTVLLLGGLTGLLLLVGNLLGGRVGLIFGLIFAILINFGMYFFSDKIVLKMYKAREVKDGEAYNLVREVSHLASLPMPRVWIIPKSTPNAFATGRDYKHSSVAVTEGIVDILSKDELKGVIAHELSHIKNRDVLIATIAATIAGVISYIAMMARWGAIFGGFGRDKDSGNMIQVLILSILTPIIALLIQMAISRSREYLADETGARMIHNPIALANALGKLDVKNKENPFKSGNEATASLFIVNPFSGRNLIKFFSTHPPLQDRIKRLKDMV